MASRSSISGSFGVGRQSAKDTLASTISYLPVTSLGLNIQQNAQTLPPEVGGQYFLRGSYKSSASGSGDVACVVRPNGFGNFLMAHSGVDTAVPVSGQTGAYQHTFEPFAPSPGVDLPWMSLIKDVARLTTEQYVNAKIRSLRVDIPKSGIATCQTSWFATTPSAVNVISTPTYDSTPQFQTACGQVTFTEEGGGSNISTQAVKMERASITMTNNISEDEFSVGNYYPDDSTLLQRTLTVDMDYIIRDTAIYSAVYFNGGTLPSTWQPEIYRGSLTILLTGTTNVVGTTQPYQLSFYYPGLDFLMFPMTLAGADLVRATLSTQVTLGPSGGDTYQYTLINGVASY